MPLTGTAVLSQRLANLYVIEGTEANVAGADYSTQMKLPTNFGDCKLYEVSVMVTGAGAGSALAPQGVLAQIVAANGARLDVVGTGLFVQWAALAGGAAPGYAAIIRLELVRLWRATEELAINIPDLETATTTGDVAIQAVVGRLRDLGAIG